MITGIEVEKRLDAGNLNVEIWRFDWVEPYLVLGSYRQMARSSRRHKFVTMPGRFYDRGDRRNNTMALIDVPFPECVKDDAYQQFISKVAVAKEYPRG